MNINYLIISLTLCTLMVNAASQSTIRPILLKRDMLPARTEQEREMVTFGFRAERLNRLKKAQAIEEAKKARERDQKEQAADITLERRLRAKISNAQYTLSEHPEKYNFAQFKPSHSVLLSKSQKTFTYSRRPGFNVPPVQIQELADIPQG